MIFASALATRLGKGQEEYGDKSFASSPLALVAELQQEALDIAGWGFILHTRLKAIEREVARLEGCWAEPEHPED